jgi:hypothetical protein
MLQGRKMSKKQEWKATASERQRKLKKSELFRIIQVSNSAGCEKEEKKYKMECQSNSDKENRKGMLWKQDYTPQVKLCNIPQSCQRKEIPPTVQGCKGLPLLK